MMMLGIFAIVIVIVVVCSLCVVSTRADECLNMNIKTRINSSIGVFRRSENETLETYCIDYTGTLSYLNIIGIKQGQKFKVLLNNKWMVVSLIMLDNTYYFETNNELIAIPQEKLSAKIIV